MTQENILTTLKLFLFSSQGDVLTCHMYTTGNNLRQVTIFQNQIHSTQSKTRGNPVCLQDTTLQSWGFIDAVFVVI
jgi:hypothetical protein